MTHLALAALLAVVSASVLHASPPEVVAATATEGPDGWTITVTLRHADSGWDHYASGWEVLDPDGARLGYRALAHPHVEEQPFTRSLSGIAIDESIDHVLIRPRCTLDGWVASPIRLDLRR
ncbi:MAG: hypothetical protein ACK4NE_02340 [Albidovulum sp.]